MTKETKISVFGNKQKQTKNMTYSRQIKIGEELYKKIENFKYVMVNMVSMVNMRNKRSMEIVERLQ